jgi:PAP2 superfamily C-terminal
MRNIWSIAWRAPAFRRALFAALLVAVPIVFLLPVFFAHIDAKPGWWPPDPVIARVGPVDVTWLTFAVLYGGILFTVVRLVRDPWLFVRGLHAYALLQLLRMAAMEAVTLEPPMRIIPLVDPITAVFYPGSTPFLKDLFFSGHTATLALMVFLSRGGTARWAMIAATIAIGALVVVQHVHWTADVLAAPAFVWLAWMGSAFTVRCCGAPNA